MMQLRLACLLITSSVLAFAQPAPVESLGGDDVALAEPQAATNEPVANNQPAQSEETLSSAQVQQQQWHNLLAMNLPQQIQTLRQQVQLLSGQVATQQHTIEALKTQLNQSYQSLSQQFESTQGQQKMVPAQESTQDERGQYRAAFEQLMQRHYTQAATALQAFVKQHPQSSLLANAQYWLGEAYFRQQRYDDALAAFQAVLQISENNTQQPGAALKIAIIQRIQGKSKEAIAGFLAIEQRYPGTTVAQLAAIQRQECQDDVANH